MRRAGAAQPDRAGKSVTGRGAEAAAAGPWRPPGGRAGQGVDARERAAARQSPERGAPDPAPAPAAGKGATGRERPGGGAGGAGATQGEGAATAGRGTGARGHRRAGRTMERPRPHSSRAEPVEGKPKSPGPRWSPLIPALPTFLPSNSTQRSRSPPHRLPIPEDASLFPPAPGLALPAGVGGGCQEGRGGWRSCLAGVVRALQRGCGWGARDTLLCQAL